MWNRASACSARLEVELHVAPVLVAVHRLGHEEERERRQAVLVAVTVGEPVQVARIDARGERAISICAEPRLGGGAPGDSPRTETVPAIATIAMVASV